MKALMRSIERLARWGWPLVIVPLAVVASELGAALERALLGLALAAALAGAASPRHRRRLARGALVLLGAATLALVLHLAGDDFGYRYAWLYSAPSCPSTSRSRTCGAARRARCCSWRRCWRSPPAASPMAAGREPARCC